jgi:uncharacterized damage-inducible protein DinB
MNPNDILRYGHRTIRTSLDAVPLDRWDEGGVCGVWSVKNIVAHLTSYEHWLIEILNAHVNGTPQPLLEQIGKLGFDGFNDVQTTQRKQLTPQQTLDEFESTYQQAAQLAAQFPAEVWPQNGTLPWYGAQYSLDDFIVYSFYGHKREHAAQVDVFKDSLKGS